jgi:VCBS repeat-containing protein
LSADQILSLTNAGDLKLTLTDSTHTGTGTVDWDYLIGDAALDFLAKDETLTITFAVTVIDNTGALVSKNIVITVTGTNDTPVIVDATSDSGNESESGFSANGTVTFTDIDLTDRPSVTTAFGTYTYTDANGDTLTLSGDRLTSLTPDLVLTPGDNTNDGSTGWSYSVADADVDFLAAGQTLTLIYDVTVSDGKGGYADQAITITIHGTNDAPVLDPRGPSLITIDEDQTANDGQTISSILNTSQSSMSGPSVSDVDDGALTGIAITDFTAQNGSWQYSIDGGTTWLDFGIYSDGQALLLGADDKVRFVPDGANGGTDTLTYRAWDQTSGIHGDTADTTTNGGSTAFSIATDTAQLTVTSINDGPFNMIPRDQFMNEAS